MPPSQTPNKPGKELLIQVLKHESVLRACLYRMVRNTSDVEDLLHSTYERLLVTSEENLKGVHSVRAFALKVATNVALDWLRHHQVIPIELVTDLAELDILDEEEKVEEIVNTDQELSLLRAAAASLSERTRQVFTLRKMYDLSQKEIAARLNMSEHTVEQHVRRAAQHCIDTLSDTNRGDRKQLRGNERKRKHAE